MATIIAFANQKGGVAKTTTTAAFGVALEKKGKRVLVIDLDPQGNLSDSVNSETQNSPTIYELMRDDVAVRDAIQHLDVFDIIPSNILLAGAEMEFTQTGKEYILKERIEKLGAEYDYILLDTPPALGFLSVNAFTAANQIIIPTTASMFAINGIDQLFSTIKNVRQYCNDSLRIRGILLTRFNPRTKISNEVKDIAQGISAYMETPVFKTHIRNSIVVEEAQARKMDLFTYMTDSTVATDYDAFADEFLKGENE